jgi:hypothetical protein
MKPPVRLSQRTSLSVKRQVGVADSRETTQLTKEQAASLLTEPIIGQW